MILNISQIIWLRLMNKYRHIVVGLIIASIYFINVLIVRIGVSIYLNLWLSRLDTDHFTQFLTAHPSPLDQQAAYYSLVFKAMFWMYLVVICGLSIVHRKKLGVKIRLIITNFNKLVIKLFKYLLYILGMTLGVYVIIFIFFNQYLSSVGENQSLINIVLLNDFNWYLIFVVLLLAPIVEEYIFRYGLITNLFKHRSNLFRVVVPAIIFSFIHIGLSQLLLAPGYAVYLLLLYMPMALVYSYVYVREKNIFFPLAIHIINNIGSILLVLIYNMK